MGFQLRNPSWRILFGKMLSATNSGLSGDRRLTRDEGWSSSEDYLSLGDGTLLVVLLVNRGLESETWLASCFISRQNRQITTDSYLLILKILASFPC